MNESIGKNFHEDWMLPVIKISVKYSKKMDHCEQKINKYCNLKGLKHTKFVLFIIFKMFN
jgi:hypothetical protein